MAPPKPNPFILFVEKRRREVQAATGAKLSLEAAVSKFASEWTFGSDSTKGAAIEVFRDLVQAEKAQVSMHENLIRKLRDLCLQFTRDYLIDVTALRPEERAPFQLQAGKKSTPRASTSEAAKRSMPFANPASFQNRPVSLNLRFAAFQGEEADGVKVNYEQWLEENPPEVGPNPLLGEDESTLDARNWKRYQIHRLCNPAYGDPTKHRFVVIHVSIYGRSMDGNVFIPGEIGMGVFSLQEGLIDNFCALVDPGQPPTGTSREFMENRIELALPSPPFHTDCADYARILHQLQRFMNAYLTAGTDTTYLFCREQETRKVRGALNWLAGKVGKTVDWDLCPYGVLVYQMSKYGQTEYVTWLKLQRELEDWREKNSVYTVSSVRKPRRQANLNPCSAESESDITSTVSQHDSSTSLYSTSASGSTNRWSDDDSDDDRGSDISSACSQLSGVSIASWTPKDAAVSIDDLERPVLRKPPSLHHRFNPIQARNLPRTSADSVSGLIEVVQAPEEEEAANTVGNLNTSRHRAVATPIGAQRRLGDNSGNYTDWELFVFEPQADAFFDSMDLASLSELGCPHHMVNTNGLQLCPLAIVNRNIYNTLDILHGFFHIHAKEGRHYPSADARAERQKRRLQVMFYANCAFKRLRGFKASAYQSQAEYESSVTSGSSRCSSTVPEYDSSSDNTSDCGTPTNRSVVVGEI